jgi:hypothetical protein
MSETVGKKSSLANRDARFFLALDTKTGKIYQMNTKCTNVGILCTNGYKIFHMAI